MLGDTLHEEVCRSFNGGVRASEAAVREIARIRACLFQGEQPSREGDTYTRCWVSCGVKPDVMLLATVTKEKEV